MSILDAWHQDAHSVEGGLGFGKFSSVLLFWRRLRAVQSSSCPSWCGRAREWTLSRIQRCAQPPACIH